MKALPGQVMRLVEVEHPGGEVSLAAEVHTGAGPVLGELVAPPEGMEGAIVFRPAPELSEALPTPTAQAEVEQLEVAQGGPLTTVEVPTEGPAGRPPAKGPTADDPRGLRGRSR